MRVFQLLHSILDSRNTVNILPVGNKIAAGSSIPLKDLKSLIVIQHTKV
jgi:hypothetical protein